MPELQDAHYSKDTQECTIIFKTLFFTCRARCAALHFRFCDAQLPQVIAQMTQVSLTQVGHLAIREANGASGV